MGPVGLTTQAGHDRSDPETGCRQLYGFARSPPWRGRLAGGMAAGWIRGRVGTIGSVGMWSMPVALPFVQADFGLTRADASLPYTLAMMGFAVGGVAMGRLCDIFGVVVTITLGCLALGGAYVGASIVPSPPTFALMHLFIGIGASATFGPLMADMSHWFLRHRGIAVGLAASGNYIGGALWPPLLQHAMVTVGWRQTYFSVGLFCVLATLPFIIALRRQTATPPTAPIA